MKMTSRLDRNVHSFKTPNKDDPMFTVFTKQKLNFTNEP